NFNIAFLSHLHIILFLAVLLTVTCAQERRYIPISTKANWNSAEAYCKSLNADLVSIHSAFEDGQARVLLRKALGNASLAWTGLSVVNNMWVWSDGKMLDYQVIVDSTENMYKNCLAMTPIMFKFQPGITVKGTI
uniref:C-type lectin domain-containing protein n=1 Tax=Erpetoichthys calabaricus TaxID=27687 RepID=A0A8C4RK48_ERPCA